MVFGLTELGIVFALVYALAVAIYFWVKIFNE